MEGRRPAAPHRQDPHRPRCRAQAAHRSPRQGREAARRPREPVHLLRRPGRRGARRGRRAGRPHHVAAHGQVHGADARARRHAGLDRQVGARRSRGGGDQEAQGNPPDRGGRRRLPRSESDPRVARAGLPRARHGGDPRVRGEGHARYGRGGHGGKSIHETGPREWRARIAKIPLVAS